MLQHHHSTRKEFHLTIKLGNAAMQHAVNIAEALRHTAVAVERGNVYGQVVDRNGNTVGSYGIEET